MKRSLKHFQYQHDNTIEGVKTGSNMTMALLQSAWLTRIHTYARTDTHTHRAMKTTLVSLNTLNCFRVKMSSQSAFHIRVVFLFLFYSFKHLDVHAHPPQHVLATSTCVNVYMCTYIWACQPPQKICCYGQQRSSTKRRFHQDRGWRRYRSKDESGEMPALIVRLTQ